MKRAYKYSKIDAFTAGDSLGNPAACLYLESGQQLSDRQMLEIAKQHKGFVSEMVYCTSESSDISLTYYSSKCEVDFCGHGTIACMYRLIKDTPALLAQPEVRIKTNRKGVLTVYNRIEEQDAVLITAPKPQYIGTKLERDLIAEQLCISSEAVSREYPVDVIDAGLRTLIVPVVGLDAEVKMFPKEQKLKEFCIANDLDIVLVFSVETMDQGYIAHTRVFAPKFGYLEDPATGSGNSAFGYYMLKNGIWDGSDCCIEQGGEDRVFNEVHLSCLDGKVLFGGSATVRIDGIYYV